MKTSCQPKTSCLSQEVTYRQDSTWGSCWRLGAPPTSCGLRWANTAGSYCRYTGWTWLYREIQHIRKFLLGLMAVKETSIRIVSCRNVDVLCLSQI